jgi:uncharacterized membrane protein
MKFVRLMVSLLGFYLLFWITKSIYHSFLKGESDIKSIVMKEWWIAGIVAVIVISINSVFIDKKEEDALSPAVVVLALTFIATFLPFSWGFVVLFNLGVIGSIAWSIYSKD